MSMCVCVCVTYNTQGSEPVFARTSSHRQPSIDGHSLSTSIKLSGSMGERFKPRNTTGTSPGPTGSAGLGGSGSALQAVATRRGSPGPGEYSAIYERIDSSRHAPPSTPGTAGRLPQILQQAGNKLSHEIKVRVCVCQGPLALFSLCAVSCAREATVRRAGVTRMWRVCEDRLLCVCVCMRLCVCVNRVGRSSS